MRAAASLLLLTACTAAAPSSSTTSAVLGTSFGRGRTTTLHDANGGLLQVRSNRMAWFVDEPGPAPLWELELDDGAVTVASTHAGVTPRFWRDAIEWRGVPVGVKGRIDVKVRWQTVGDALHGWIEVDNDTTLSLTAVRFPIVRLRPTGSAPADAHTLVMSRAFGRSQRNPFAGPLGYGFGAHAGLEAPGPMQFGAMIDDAGRGLYFATHDRDARHKRFFYVPSLSTADPFVSTFIQHVPENTVAAGNDYIQPYPVVLQTFDGDWWDAAQLYRAWAVQQVWTSKGPLATRTDYPAWLLETDAWVRLDSHWAQQQEEAHLPTMHAEIPLTRSAVQHYNWFEEGSWTDPGRPIPTTLAGDAQAMRNVDAEPFPYLNTIAWDRAAPSFTPQIESFALKRWDGTPYTQTETVHLQSDATHPTDYTITATSVEVCATSAALTAQLVNQAVALVDEGNSAGVYLDQLGGQVDRPCHDSTHGHPTGGGTYAADHVRSMLAQMRSGIAAVDPNAALAGEAIAETFVDLVDVRLNHYNLWPGEVPLWGVIYGDYLPSFGRTTNPPIDPTDFTFEAALVSDLLRGSAIGRLPVNSRWWNPQTDPARIAFLTDAIAYRRAFADFVVLGRMQRDVTLTGAIPTTSAIYRQTSTLTLRMDVPVVRARAWSTGGQLGVLVVNLSDVPRNVTLQMELDRFEIPVALVYSVAEMSTAGVVAMHTSGASLSHWIALGPRSMKMFVLTPQ
ncbi:MAG: DUF6259 domain-containing protein [Deltaproteobacteria bacterium]|jgi:hypothetical protein